MTAKADKPLTPKQQRFCEEYVKDHNGAQAAIRAGYSVRTAREQAAALLTKHHIKALVASLDHKVSDAAGVNAVYLRTKVRDLFERCAASGSEEYNPVAALKAGDMLAKHIGWYAEDNRQKHAVQEMTDAQLAEYRRELDQRISAIEGEGRSGRGAPSPAPTQRTH